MRSMTTANNTRADSSRLKAITARERRTMIRHAAYFHALMARFEGSPEEHWKAAEAQVDDLIRKMNRWRPGGYGP